VNTDQEKKDMWMVVVLTFSLDLIRRMIAFKVTGHL
jgi:hypothetical protein